MAPLLKNKHLLHGISEEQKSEIDKAALEHEQDSNISFNILESTADKVVIIAQQGENSAENYFSEQVLIEIGKETFEKFFPDKKITIYAIPFKK